VPKIALRPGIYGLLNSKTEISKPKILVFSKNITTVRFDWTPGSIDGGSPLSPSTLHKPLQHLASLPQQPNPQSSPLSQTQRSSLSSFTTLVPFHWPFVGNYHKNDDDRGATTVRFDWTPGNSDGGSPLSQPNRKNFKWPAGCDFAYKPLRYIPQRKLRGETVPKTALRPGIYGLSNRKTETFSKNIGFKPKVSAYFNRKFKNEIFDEIEIFKTENFE
jgi:hypothetical protein